MGEGKGEGEVTGYWRKFIVRSFIVYILLTKYYNVFM